MEKLQDVSQLFDGAVVYLHENNIRYIGKCTIIQQDNIPYLISLDFKNNQAYHYNDFEDYFDCRFYLVDDAGLNPAEKRYLDKGRVEIFDPRADMAKKAGQLLAYMSRKNQVVKYTRWIQELKTVFSDPDLIKSRESLDALVYNSEITKNLRFSVIYLLKIYRKRCAELHSEIDSMLNLEHR